MRAHGGCSHHAINTVVGGPDSCSSAPQPTLHVEPVQAAAFSPNGQVLVTSSGFTDVEDAVELWNTRTGKLEGVFKGHKQPVFSLAFSRNKNRSSEN